MDWKSIIQEVLKDKLAIFAFPLFLLAIIAEIAISHHKKRNLYDAKDSFTSFCMLIFTEVLEFIPKIIAFAAFYYLHKLSPLQEVILRQWWAWLILFLLDDFTYYWFHRLNHEVRLFWAGHVPHHSSVKMNFGTALRQGVGERIHKFFFWLWLPLLGFDPLMVFTMMAISLIYQFWVHTELVTKLPKAFEYVFNTPSHHRVHHASNIRYLDRNHAGVLIIWDRIFRTFSPEIETDQPKYGLTKNIETYQPF